MKFICLSDVHLSSDNSYARVDDLVSVQFDKLEFILKLAKDENASILQAGDLFHRPRSWMLLPLVMDLLKRYDVDFYCVRGQHDDYMYSTETKDRTSLGILVKAGLVIPLSAEKPVIVHDVALYGANFGQQLGKADRKRFAVGVVHASISDAPLWPGHQFTAADKYLKDNPDYKFILVGDVHRRFEVADKSRHLVNTGPMLRREATEYNFEHEPSVFLFNTDDNTKEWIEIPHKPANQVLSRDHIERKAEAETLLDEFVKMMKETHPEMKQAGEGVSFVENLAEFAKTNNIDKSVMDIIAKLVERSKEGL